MSRPGEFSILLTVLLAIVVGAIVGAATRDVPSAVLVGAGFAVGLWLGRAR